MKKYSLAVTDTETTGIGEEHQVVEVAIVTVGARIKRWGSLVKPTCQMSLEARATHHITDDELKNAPTMEKLLKDGELVSQLVSSKDVETVFVAHNAEFDRTMLIQSGVPPLVMPAQTIDTWKCGLHKYPDSPSHSNQVLRYYLDVIVPKVPGPPHRALPDALVTAAILGMMLRDSTVDELIDLTKKPVLLKKVSFGKYRGRLWSEMDAGFLHFILKKDFNSDVHFTARHWLTNMRR